MPHSQLHLCYGWLLLLLLLMVVVLLLLLWPAAIDTY
jgi:hypothetical protein